MCSKWYAWQVESIGLMVIIYFPQKVTIKSPESWKRNKTSKISARITLAHNVSSTLNAV